jgi:hypothetical protein
MGFLDFIERLFGQQQVSSEPPATNAQVGYIISLMDEVGVDTLDITGLDGANIKVTPNQVHLLRKGDASQVITALLKERDNKR